MNAFLFSYVLQVATPLLGATVLLNFKNSLSSEYQIVNHHAIGEFNNFEWGELNNAKCV